MERNVLNDLLVFAAVAEQRSFMKAAAKLGFAQSSLSRMVRELEERWGRAPACPHHAQRRPI